MLPINTVIRKFFFILLVTFLFLTSTIFDVSRADEAEPAKPAVPPNEFFGHVNGVVDLHSKNIKGATVYLYMREVSQAAFSASDKKISDAKEKEDKNENSAKPKPASQNSVYGFFEVGQVGSHDQEKIEFKIKIEPGEYETTVFIKKSKTCPQAPMIYNDSKRGFLGCFPTKEDISCFGKTVNLKANQYESVVFNCEIK